MPHLQESILTRAYARVGLLGNPSDGFQGKTLSVLISNFFAELHLIPNKYSLSQEYQAIHLKSPTSDQITYLSFQSLATTTYNQKKEQSDGESLLWATCKVFFRYCLEHEILLHHQGFSAFFDTNIPQQVGLAGSSAIISAFWKALMSHYGINRNQISLALQASLVLSVEKNELGIVAGLQDRVIQAYGGLVFMDFEKIHLQKYGIGKYERIPLENLPQGLWIAYESQPSNSSKIHSDVYKRWEAGEKKIVNAITSFKEIAEKGRRILLNGAGKTCRSEFAQLMNENFNLRREIYGDEMIGPGNLRMIDIARKHGYAAKLTGSGGAVVGLWAGRNEEIKDYYLNVQFKLETEGFKFEWLRFQPEEIE
ncbi:hypothetical protein G9A89_015943 [Geosiphon pyriformis]|nr:hypothetical protein G9A89_015943 [Geosiphon pyriformis]